MRYIKQPQIRRPSHPGFEAAVLRHQFGVLHVHNLKETMNKERRRL